MLDVFRKKAKIIIYLTAFVFIVGMAIMGIGGLFEQGRRTTVGRIAGQSISYQEYEQYLRNAMQTYMNENPGEELDERTIEMLNDQTWQQLVQRILFDQEVRRRRIRVRDADVIDRLKNNPPDFVRSAEIFQTDGVFDHQRYLNTLLTGQTPEGQPIDLDWLEMHVRDQLPYELLMEEVQSEVVVTEEEAREDYIKRNNKADTKIIFFDANKITGIEVTDEVVREHFERNMDRYRKDPSCRYAFVRFDIQPSDADKERALERIEDIHRRVLAGEDFAELARQYSDDHSNAHNGGDLGPFTRNVMVPEFDDVAFNLEVDEISDPVHTEFGWHVIKVTETGIDDPSGEEQIRASHILIEETPSEETIEMTRQRAEEFRELAVRSSIHEAAEQQGYRVQESRLFEKDAHFIQGLGRFQEMIRFAFENSVGDVAPVKQSETDAFFVMEIAEQLPERYPEFSEVRARIRTSIRTERRREKSAERAREFYETHSPEDYLRIAEEDGWEILEAEAVTAERALPRLGLVRNLNQAILNTDEGEFTDIITGQRGAFLAYVESKQLPDMEEFEERKDQLVQELRTRKQSEHLNQWYQSLMEEAEIVDNRDQFFR